MTTSAVLPIIALLGKTTFVDVTYPDYLLHAAPIGAVLIGMVLWLRKANLLRPVGSKVISWEIPVFLFARWPWALLGTVSAFYNWVTGSFVDFKVTPKGTTAADPLPFRVIAPYAFLSIASAAPAIAVPNAKFASGFYIFGLINALIYGTIFTLALVKHQREKRVPAYGFTYATGTVIASCAMFLAIGLGWELRGLRGLDAVTYGIPYVELTDRTFPVSGAGQGGDGEWSVSFHPHWVDDSELILPAQSNEGGVATRN